MSNFFWDSNNLLFSTQLLGDYAYGHQGFRALENLREPMTDTRCLHNNLILHSQQL